MTQQAATATLLPAQERARLKRDFRKDLKGEVTLRLFTMTPSPIAVPGRDCRLCPQTRSLLEELAALSPRLHLEITDYYAQAEAAAQWGIERIPATLLDADGRLRFYGLPGGRQLPALIEAVKLVSRRAAAGGAAARAVSPLSGGARRQLRALNRPVRLQVFVTPGSQSSPAMARLAWALALENPRIAAAVIEAEEFPALAQRYGVRSVPHTVINDQLPLPGLPNEAELVEKLLQAGARPEEPA